MVGSPLLETTEEELDLVLNINLRASFLLSQRVAQCMVDAGKGGAIIHNSSVVALWDSVTWRPMVRQRQV